MGKKLNYRIARLERALPEPPTGTHPYWEAFARRVKISGLYMAWLRREIEKPEFADPCDLELWEHLETITSVAKKIVARRAEAPGAEPEYGWYSDEEGE